MIEAALEALYEKRRRKTLEQKENDKSVVQVDPLAAFPVKILDGEVYYQTHFGGSVQCLLEKTLYSRQGTI